MSDNDNDYIEIIANAFTTHGRTYEPEASARFGLCLAYGEAARAAAQVRGKAGFPLNVTSVLEDFMLSTSEHPLVPFGPYVHFSRKGDTVTRVAHNFPAPPFAGGKARDDIKVPLVNKASAEQLKGQMREWVQESVRVLAHQFVQKQGR
jgi:hypothetical protein